MSALTARLRSAFAPVAPAYTSARRFERGGRDQRPVAPIFARPGQSVAAHGALMREARDLYGCMCRPEIAEPFLERLGVLTFSDGGMNALRQGLVAALVDNPAIDADGLHATLLEQGYGQTIQRMHLHASVRRRPTALLGDSADAAEWLNHSIEATEQRDAEQNILKRARALTDDDDRAMAAVDLDVAARVIRQDTGETR